ncbi:MAG: sigma-70 family RNA polymerase sigma factor [Hydrogeniiclostridium mannosilyticum]
MKKINLRDYYPFYTTDTIVEVPDEVADLLHEYKLNEAAYILRTGTKAYFRWTMMPMSSDALVIVLTPADILEREENARLYQARLFAGETAESGLCALFSWHEQIGYCKSGEPIRTEYSLYQCRCEVGKVFERTFLTDATCPK